MANFFPPSVTGIDREVDLNRSIRARLLFDYADLDGNKAEKYRFFDSNGGNQTGFFTLNGQKQNAGQWFEIEASQLDRVLYHSGLVLGNEVINVLAYDGKFWSEAGTARAFTVKPNLRAPVVETNNFSVLAYETFLGADMFSASDFDGDDIVKYRVRDQRNNKNSGAFFLNNVKQHQSKWFEFSASELSKLRYHAGNNGQTEKFFVKAYDGEKWSKTAVGNATTTPNRKKPKIETVDRELKTNTVVNAQTMFVATDEDGNSFKNYSFFDTGSLSDGGFFTVNDVRQAPRQWFTVAARDVEAGLVEYHAASVPDSERLRVKVNDGKFSSKVNTFRVDSVATPDVEVVGNVQVLDDSTIIDVTSWFSQTDTGPVVDTWQFFDATAELDGFGNELSGSLTYQGNALPAQRVRQYTSAQLADLSFKSGVADRGIEHDEVYIRGKNDAAGYWTPWQRVNLTSVFNVIPALTAPAQKWGAPVLGTGATLTYSFMEALPAYYLGLDEDNGTFQAFTPAMRQATREVLKYYSDTFNIDFVETSDTVGGVMRFGMVDNTGAIAYAYFPPGFGAPTNNVNAVPGDIWAELDFLYESVDQNGNDISFGWFDDDAMQKGNDLYLALIHEVGHAIGLYHPFPPTQPGKDVLREPVQKHEYTTMSYGRMGNIVDQAYPYRDGPATTQLYDNYAINHLYGHDQEVNKEDNVYRYTPNEHEEYAMTIHDPGGVDTLNFSNYTPSSVIDLREGRHSSIAGEVDNFAISFGTIIENVIAGSGHDVITGNEADNRIIGGRGDDVISGMGGRDTLIGQEGRDTYKYTLGDGRVTIDEQRGGGKDRIEITSFHEDFDSFEEDLSFRTINGRDLVIALTMDGGAAEGSITIKNQKWAASRNEVVSIYRANGEQIGPDISLNSVFLQATDKLQRFKLTDFQDQFGQLAIPS